MSYLDFFLNEHKKQYNSEMYLIAVFIQHKDPKCNQHNKKTIKI